MGQRLVGLTALTHNLIARCKRDSDVSQTTDQRPRLLARWGRRRLGKLRHAKHRIWIVSHSQFAYMPEPRNIIVCSGGLGYRGPLEMSMNEIEARRGLTSRPAALVAFDDEEPPSRPRRHPFWKDIPDDKWEDWRWQSQNAIKTTKQLTELLSFSADEVSSLLKLESEFKTAIPPYYFSLIDPDDPQDPIRLQSCPSAMELENPSGFELEDPLEEDKDMPVPGLTHRYPDRCLIAITGVCTMYCRFCTRKRKTLTRGGWESVTADDERMIDYIRKHTEIRDVIVSGGDPLTLNTGKLKYFLDALGAIKHVDVIRIGTRVPVTLPQRLFDQKLIDLLGSNGKVWIQTHFNHPREVTPESARACLSLLKAGCPVNNHTVLMKGVNDSVEVMRALMRAVLRIKVRPYYIFHCDPVIGAGHFRTSVWKGLEIMEGLRGHMSGLGVPTYVVDSPHGGGKIPLMPNYLVSASNDSVILRNYEGMLVRYQAEDKPVEEEVKTRTRGVSKLLQGDQTFLIPEGSERMARRRKIALEQVAQQMSCSDSDLEPGDSMMGSISAIPIPAMDDGSDLESSDLEPMVEGPIKVKVC